MSTKPRVGFIGVGLMGHDMAKNILAYGYELTIMGHKNRKPVADLVKRGALYMPALVASRFNPALRDKYQAMINAGKPAK